jgi:hypothetical protein
VLQACWRDWRLGTAAALASGALYGLVAGWWTPRGPVTTVAALATMVVSAVAGMIAGLALRSRWAMLLTPLAFVASFELVRIGAVGPTVDGPHLSQSATSST